MICRLESSAPASVSIMAQPDAAERGRGKFVVSSVPEWNEGRERVRRLLRERAGNQRYAGDGPMWTDGVRSRRLSIEGFLWLGSVASLFLAAILLRPFALVFALIWTVVTAVAVRCFCILQPQHNAKCIGLGRRSISCVGHARRHTLPLARTEAPNIASIRGASHGNRLCSAHQPIAPLL